MLFFLFFLLKKFAALEVYLLDRCDGGVEDGSGRHQPRHAVECAGVEEGGGVQRPGRRELQQAGDGDSLGLHQAIQHLRPRTELGCELVRAAENEGLDR